MNRRTGIAVVILLVILGLIFWLQDRQNDEKQTTDDQLQLILSITARNQTKNQDAAETTANPNDIIVYTLNVENPHDDVIRGYVAEVNIADITEAANLVDVSGANYNPAAGSLSWTPLDIPVKGKIEKTFTVRIKENIPADSDLVMTTKYNNELTLKVTKERLAGENVTQPTPTPPYKSPTTGASENLIVILAIITTAIIYGFNRSRQKLTA